MNSPVRRLWRSGGAVHHRAIRGARSLNPELQVQSRGVANRAARAPHERRGGLGRWFPRVPAARVEALLLCSSGSAGEERFTWRCVLRRKAGETSEACLQPRRALGVPPRGHARNTFALEDGYHNGARRWMPWLSHQAAVGPMGATGLGVFRLCGAECEDPRTWVGVCIVHVAQ
eukprot:1178100-Prorocentrum_minimum.AAC.1